MKIYTNLSNLGEKVPKSLLPNEITGVSNSLYPSNLIGFLGRWKFLSGGAFYASEGYDVSLGSSGANSDLYTYGDSSTSKYTSSYDDQLNLGLGGRELIGVGTINLFGLRLGVMGRLRSFHATYEASSSSSDLNYQNNALERTHNHNYETKLEFGRTAFGLIAGTLIGGEHTELSVSGGINPISASFSSSFVEDWITKPFWTSNSYYHYDSNPAHNYALNNDDEKYEVSLVGSELFARGRLMTQVGEATRTSLMGKISTGIYPITLTDQYHTWVETNKPDYTVGSGSSPDSVYGYYHLNDYLRKQNGSGNLNLYQIQAGIGFEHTFSNEAVVILGVKGTYMPISSTLDMDPLTRVTTYKDLYNDPDQEDEGYIETINYNDLFSMKVSGNVVFLEIPSALEFQLFKKMDFRVGSNQIIPIYGNGKYESSYTDRPDRTRIEYTDGPNAGNVEESTASGESLSSGSDALKISSTNINFSTFHTGLGYQVNENIQVDILHYTNLTNLSTWYLSFTVGF